MKLSIITTFTTDRQEPWKESLECYSELADEVIVVYDQKDADITAYIKDKPKIYGYHMDWPYEYDWSQFPKVFNYALEKATGDWVLKFDIDLLVHEQDFMRFRDCLEKNPSAAVVTLQKISIVGLYWYSKGQMALCLNKRAFPNLRFGGEIRADGKPDDLVEIIFPEEMRKGVPFGQKATSIARSGVRYFNFDYSFKDPAIAKRDFTRMARAWKRYHGTGDFGEDDERALEFYKNLREHKKTQAINPISQLDLPRFIRDKYLTTL